jgi:hypothetical protein
LGFPFGMVETGFVAPTKAAERSLGPKIQAVFRLHVFWAEMDARGQELGAA